MWTKRIPRGAVVWFALAWNLLWLGPMILPRFLSSATAYAVTFSALFVTIGICAWQGLVLVRRRG